MIKQTAFLAALVYKDLFIDFIWLGPSNAPFHIHICSSATRFARITLNLPNLFRHYLGAVISIRIPSHFFPSSSYKKKTNHRLLSRIIRHGFLISWYRISHLGNHLFIQPSEVQYLHAFIPIKLILITTNKFISYCAWFRIVYRRHNWGPFHKNAHIAFPIGYI